MDIRTVIDFLDKIAPPALQESYDNAGLITGDITTACSGVLLALDVTEAVIEEALQQNCNLVVAHHPIIFKGLKRLVGKSYVERTVITVSYTHLDVYKRQPLYVANTTLKSRLSTFCSKYFSYNSLVG